MAVRNGDNSNNIEYMSNWGAPVYPETAHQYNALGGNDTVYGSAYTDFIIGGSGDDTLYGNGGNDCLIGETGNDKLYGGAGDDNLYAGNEDAGADRLEGGAGTDFMSGGQGDDLYVHGLNCGTDTINDGMTAGWVTGYGGGSDGVWFTGLTIDQISYIHPTGSNDLWLGSTTDLLDGQVNDGVIIKDFYANESNTFIEVIYDSTGQGYYLSGLLSA